MLIDPFDEAKGLRHAGPKTQQSFASETESEIGFGETLKTFSAWSTLSVSQQKCLIRLAYCEDDTSDH